MVLRPKTDVVLEEFLPFFMQSDIFMDRAVKISVGGLSPTINWRDLAKEEFALPPLEQQRRIAEVLQAATRAQDSGFESLSSLNRVSEAFCAETASSLAEEYSSVRLEEVADVRYGLTVNQARRKVRFRAPYLRVANVLRGVLDLSEVKETRSLARRRGLRVAHWRRVDRRGARELSGDRTSLRLVGAGTGNDAPEPSDPYALW